MELAGLLLKQNLTMMLYMLIGLALFKAKFLTLKGSAELGKMLIYVTIPASILKPYMIEFSKEKLIGLLIAFAAAALSLVIAAVISKFIFEKKSDIRYFGAIFSNAGFIGIPLAQMTLGDEAVFYIAAYVVLVNALQQTYGILILTKDKSYISPKKIIQSPAVIAFITALILFLLPVKVPDICMSVVSGLAAMNGPLAMILLGGYLAQVTVKELLTDGLTYMCMAVRLVIAPLITVFVLMLIPKDFIMIRMAILLAAAAPVGSNSAVFAQLYNNDYKGGVKDVCLTTIASIATLPLIFLLAQAVWGM